MMEGEREREREGWRSTGMEVSGLNFAYDGQPPIFTRFNLCVFPASRCLLVGANGSGWFSSLSLISPDLNWNNPRSRYDQ
jgi:ABC-type transport system involved in cytochrome bd biosynthesis fused ATPase/permease subunit